MTTARVVTNKSADPTRVLLADGAIDLRLGRWQDVLADVTTCDAVICDPPYSARTDEGYRTATDFAADKRRSNEACIDKTLGTMPRTRFELSYAPLTEEGARELAQFALRVCKQWMVAFGDHESARWHSANLDAAGWLVFAPVIWHRLGSAPRFFGDGPASECEHITVARPRKLPEIRASRPGFYQTGFRGEKFVTGGKPIELMRRVVRDYTRPGDLVVDPFCGGGTTALACAMEGRRCITSECDPDTFAKAKARLERGFTRDMFSGVGG